MFNVCIYLLAIILANLSVTWFGPGSMIVNAFLFIGLDLTTRDKLHDSWKGQQLVLKMAMLIMAGSILSWLLNRDAGPIAFASFVAFATSAVADTIVYTWLYDSSRQVRINGSNLAGAAVDSVVFPTLAFGVVLPWITLGQFIAKVTGGYLWSLILSDRDKEPSPNNEIPIQA